MWLRIGAYVIAQWLVCIAVRRLPPEGRERAREEWLADLADIPGAFDQLLWAGGCHWAATRVNIRRPSPALAALIAFALAWESAVRYLPAPAPRMGGMVVSFAPGGPTDLVARRIARRIGEELGQPVDVENVEGKGGMTGAARVAGARPDGHDIPILFGTMGTQAGVQTYYEHPLYDAATDFTPVALIAEFSIVLVVRNDLQVADLPQFIEHARKNRNKIKGGSAGRGSASHLACDMLDEAMGIPEIKLEEFGGTAPAMSELQAGRIDYLCDIIPTAKLQIDAGNVRAIALLAKTRSRALPDLPTASEQGLDVEARTWNALFLPKNLPDAIVAKLNAAVLQVMHDPSVKADLERLGARIVSDDRATPASLDAFVKSEIERLAMWRKPSAGSIQFSELSQGTGMSPQHQLPWTGALPPRLHISRPRLGS